MRYYICFSCLNIHNSSVNGRCLNCDSRNILYFNDSRITSTKDFYKLKVMMRVLKSQKEKVLYVLDYAIYLGTAHGIELFPSTHISMLEEKRDHIASRSGDV